MCIFVLLCRKFLKFSPEHLLTLAHNYLCWLVRDFIWWLDIKYLTIIVICSPAQFPNRIDSHCPVEREKKKESKYIMCFCWKRVVQKLAKPHQALNNFNKSLRCSRVTEKNTDSSNGENFPPFIVLILYHVLKGDLTRFVLT